MKRRSCFATILIIMLIILCVGVLATGWLVSNIPEQVESSFGPPSANLSPVQRIYLSIQLMLLSDQLEQPLDPLGEPRTFSVDPGESTHSIIARLQSEGLVADADALRIYLVYSGIDTTIQSGEFKISPRMSALEIANALQDATPGEITFSILAGWRAEEIAAAIPTSGLSFTPESFLSAVASPDPFQEEFLALPPGTSLEGFLFPDLYRVDRQISVQALIATILEDFHNKVSIDMLEGFKDQGLSIFEAVTLASIVQREAIVKDEMPMIASVLLNRIAASMKLETDPTVQYALGFNREQNSWWTNPLSRNDLAFDSPYNTYLYPGLPPGPIANPSLDALKAVAFPAQSPYYYFRAVCDGSGRHTFAETFEEHQQNACP